MPNCNTLITENGRMTSARFFGNPYTRALSHTLACTCTRQNKGSVTGSCCFCDELNEGRKLALSDFSRTPHVRLVPFFYIPLKSVQGFQLPKDNWRDLTQPWQRHVGWGSICLFGARGISERLIWWWFLSSYSRIKGEGSANNALLLY